MNKVFKNELVYFRATVCILIIFTHILTLYINSLDVDINELKTLYYIQNAFIFGTPSFIILSQLLTTFNYKSIDKRYLWSRFKYIFLPYILVGSFYCFSESANTNTAFTKQFIENILLGKWYGYFILIILQFYILSYIIYKINYKLFNSKVLLILSLIVQVVFLYNLHNNNAFHELFKQFYPLSENTFILGWIFYFFIGGYIGMNYNKFITLANKYISILMVFAIISFLGFVFFKNHDYWTTMSYDEYLVFYNTFMFCILLIICTHIQSIMKQTVNVISIYSFFVYLLHPIILDSIYNFTSRFQDKTIIFLATSLLFTLGICIGTGILLTEFNIFRFVIGKQPYKIKKID
ncbi:polysaccharide intercellular adhesin biosynthesis/export protein IcaC [Staphylococcus gallinarum]|uniref:polysaccharide intercellular adhesin biosynthesis/export protein IcaC n=1 Tax=Staphylococcus gallinarum TaxID=1293 RepID=UPI002DBCD4BD|nr:polysaccharide intercellular adhesin biosynthesis/export protein IcaC [Staphylococcus gallinarum]MEB7040079.1 polysaccharide intercellular adhesin biosynthesis/export protein IcaC [Staphylococcus gallinarum]